MQRDEGLRECLAQCKVIAFDVDGTLTDSIEQIITCFQRTFAYANLPVPSPEAIKGTIGMTLELGIRSLLPDPTDIKLGQEVTQLYRDTFAVSKDISETRLFPHCLELLAALHERGYILAIASGKSQVGIKRVFTDIPQLQDYFSIVCTGDMCESKPSPAMINLIAARAHVKAHEILGVGDAALDVQMFRNARCHELGVLSGVCDDYDFEDLTVEFYLPRVTDLMKYL